MRLLGHQQFAPPRLLVNADAGWVKVRGIARTVRRLARALDVPVGDVVVSAGGSLSSDLWALGRSGRQGVAIVGGDGSGRTALDILTPLGIPVAPLPGGTMNRLAARVFGRTSLGGCLKALKGARPQWLPGGRIGHRHFFVAAGCGRWMDLNAVREALRRGDPGAAWRAFEALRPSLFRGGVRIDGDEAEADLALFGIGPVDAAFGFGRGDAPDGEGLEMAVLRPKDWGGLATIGAKVLAGGWRRTRGVEAGWVRRVTVGSPDGPLSWLADGEPMTTRGPVCIGYEPRAGLVLGR